MLEASFSEGNLRSFSKKKANTATTKSVPLSTGATEEESPYVSMCFADRCDHAIPLFLRAKTSPIHFLCYKLLAEAMHAVNNDVIPFTIKGLVHPYRKKSFI